MDDNERLFHRRREQILVASFAAMAAVVLFVAFAIATAGLLFYILLVVAGMTLFGLFHYLLWGRIMSEDLAGERAALEERERLEAMDEDDPRRPRHF